MHHCEFCEEFAGKAPRLEKLYGSMLPTRIIARTDRFVALPTLGQLFTGSVLILPLAHVETCALLSSDERRELDEFAADVALRVRKFGEPIMFEHGALRRTGGGCGIYHAHLHIVPVPKITAATALFPEHQCRATNLLDALHELQGTDEYLLINAGDQTLFSDLGGQTGKYPSQFFRRRIAEHFHLELPWDWRAYAEAEPALLRTLDLSAT